jgi:pilus assembly protein Flp/PilA
LDGLFIARGCILMAKFLLRFARDDRGATAIEYGLIVALISIVVITAVTTVGNNLKTKFNAVATSI